jgi:hypothetical protein
VSAIKPHITHATIGAILCLVLFSACSEKGKGTRAINIPPRTFIASGPAEDTPTHFKAHIFWYGSDDDGYVDHFLIKTIKGADRMNFPPGFDWDSLEAWTRTTSKDSTFVFLADSCCTGSGMAVSALSSWGVLLRAVDNEGAVSPEPATIFLQASNVIPRVKIVSPVSLPIEYMAVPPHPYIAWEGMDPDGDDEKLQYKYIVLPEADLDPRHPILPPVDKVRPNNPTEGNVAAPIGYWSEWVPADCTYVSDLDLTAYKATLEPIMIYVTVKDEANAYLPEKLYGTYNGGVNFIRLIIVSTGAGVTCVIDGGSLGMRTSSDVAEYRGKVTSLFEGTEISFRFYGKEDRSRGEVAKAYKYYWDSPQLSCSAWDYWSSTEPIRQQGVTPEWIVRYPLDGTKLSASLGQHVLVVRLKDRNETTSECQFRIEVLAGPKVAPEQKILLVDDNDAHWPEQRWNGFEEVHDSLWADILHGYNWEKFDTGPNYDKAVPVRLIGDATTVIWLVDQDDTTIPPTALIDCCTESGNFLFSYVRVGGNLIILGKNPVYACGYWSDAYPDPSRRGWYTGWRFNPASRPSSPDTTNFMWEIFGIKSMQLSKVPFTAVWSCPESYQALQDTIELGPQATHIDGFFEYAIYITDLREGMDVRPLFSTAIKDRSGNWIDSRRGEDPNYIAVYVPGNDRRGHAAYIGFPELWFDHAKIKTMIRKLLSEFGEQTD